LHNDQFIAIQSLIGLEIGGGFGASGEPWFVADKRLNSNELVVVQGDNPPDFYVFFVCIYLLITFSPYKCISTEIKCPPSTRNKEVQLSYD
jgi:tRNA U34 2-thiouridine synthase MnmA/TrmU